MFDEREISVSVKNHGVRREQSTFGFKLRVLVRAVRT